MRISVIVPALDEEGSLPAALASARGPFVAERIVVDGGSADRTVELARCHADVVLESPRCRAAQMNVGARAACGDALLFLHADTRLPGGFDGYVVAALADTGVVGGRFDVCLWPSSPLLRLTGYLMNVRSRWTAIATGDQAIFVRRHVYEQIGGFAEIPLMEDVAFSAALKRRGRVACLRQQVVTSSRRWQRDGVARTILLMWSLRFLYFCGVEPERLRRLYADRR